MTTKLLLPNRFKMIGWLLLIPSSLFGLYMIAIGFEEALIDGPAFAILNDGLTEGQKTFELIRTNLTNTIVGTLFLLGALLVAFSREKHEDEFIAKLRLNSLLWAVLVNYVLLLLGFLFVYGLAFISVMLYNMFTVLVIFILRFQFILYQNTKTVSDEKYHQGTAGY